MKMTEIAVNAKKVRRYGIAILSGTTNLRTSDKIFDVRLLMPHIIHV